MIYNIFFVLFVISLIIGIWFKLEEGFKELKKINYDRLFKIRYTHSKNFI